MTHAISTMNPVNAMDLVDPLLRPTLEFILNAASPLHGPLRPDLVNGMRQFIESRAKPFLSSPSVAEHAVPGAVGRPEVRVFVVNALKGASRPAIIFLHGGGFVAGSAAASVADLQLQAEKLDCVIVAVDYRRAPETPFPGALDDNYAVLAWLHAQKRELGIDSSRIALQGESAGGAHAAMLAIAARNRGEFAPCFLALSQPALDDRTGSTRMPAEHFGAFLWRPELNLAAWQALLGAAPGGATVPAGAVPARELNLQGLPPTFIGVGALDLFLEEGVEFALQLARAGVPIELLVVPGAFHAFDVLVPDSAPAQRYKQALFSALARSFGMLALQG